MMCKCLKCNRTVLEILNVPREAYTKRVPVLYLSEGAVPICLRCATEDVIPLSFYGKAIIEYDVESGKFVCTDNRLNGITYQITDTAMKNNNNIYLQIYKDLPKPSRLVLSM